MTVNRQQRRAGDAAAKKKLRLQMQCLTRGHVWPDAWIMRPAWVGAGVVLPKVHFDRRCSRCGDFQAEWRDVEGETTGQPTALRLPAWLLANQATVTPPPGDVRNPPVDELEAMAPASEEAKAQ